MTTAKPRYFIASQQLLDEIHRWALDDKTDDLIVGRFLAICAHIGMASHEIYDIYQIDRLAHDNDGSINKAILPSRQSAISTNRESIKWAIRERDALARFIKRTNYHVAPKENTASDILPTLRSHSGKAKSGDALMWKNCGAMSGRKEID